MIEVVFYVGRAEGRLPTESIAEAVELSASLAVGGVDLEAVLGPGGEVVLDRHELRTVLLSRERGVEP